MSEKFLKQCTKNLEEYLKKVFYELHENPELSNEEFETTKNIRKFLESVGITILDIPLRTGLVAVIEGKKDGPEVALRCDIDGLPILEQTDIAHKSKVKGKMHGCGHDFHTAVMIGSAYLLKEIEKDLKGKIKIIFQPAEETGHGAEDVIKTGVLENTKAIFGLHNTNYLDVGELGSKTGALTAAVDRFEISIEGIGVHAAIPERGNDPIVVAGNIISTIQTIISRNIGVFENAVVSITHIQAGNTWNVIPSAAYIEGTVRTLNNQNRNLIKNRLQEINKGIAIAYGVDIKFLWHEGPPETNNDKDWTDFVLEIAKNSGYKIKEVQSGMGGEDFAYYQKNIKGAFVYIGTGYSCPHHHPQFVIDENAIIGASKYFANLAKESLIKLSTNNKKE